MHAHYLGCFTLSSVLDLRDVREAGDLSGAFRVTLGFFGGVRTGGLVRNRARFARKTSDVKAVARTRKRTTVPNRRPPVGRGPSSFAPEV